jgi:hypothetical protein
LSLLLSDKIVISLNNDEIYFGGNKNKTADDFGAISRETPRLICDSWSDPD